MTATAEDLGQVIALQSTIGPYTIKKFLGAGAWKQTFEAQRKDGTRWALKFFFPNEHAKKIAADRGITQDTFWRKECRNGNSGSDYLTSSFIEEIDGLKVQAEELLDDTLENRLKKGREFSERETVDIALRLARGLAEFHTKFHVPHGDVKPTNIGFSGNKVKLFDYGTATVHLNGRGADTPYRAPETYSERIKFGFATDIWSYGAVVYRLLTGKDIEVTKEYRSEIREEVHKQINQNIKNKRLRELLYRCLNTDENLRIRDGRELEEHIEEIVKSIDIKYRLIRLVKPTALILAGAIAGGIIAGYVTEAIINPEPPVNLQLPVVGRGGGVFFDNDILEQELILSEGFSVYTHEAREEWIAKEKSKRKSVPFVIWGVEDMGMHPLPQHITNGNEISRATQFHYVATLITAYENAYAEIVSRLHNIDAGGIGPLRYTITEYQRAMYNTIEFSNYSQPEDMLNKILTRAIAQLAVKQSDGTAVVDLEDVCTSAVVGTTLMHQAQMTAYDSGNPSFRNFSVYIDAQYPNGEYVISHKKEFPYSYNKEEQPQYSIADFLKAFVQYAHQAAVPVQDFQPLVISE